MCGLVGFGVGGPLRPGLVRVGVGVGVADGGAAVVPAVVVPVVESRAVAAVVLGTTSTTRRRGGAHLRGGAALTGVAEAGREVGAPAAPSWQHGRVSEQQKQADNRARATTDEFRAFVKEGWAPRHSTVSGPAPGAAPAAARRDVLSAAYPGQRLVVPAGGLKVRSNDTDYVFRPHTAFAWLTGLGADREPDAVLVLEPVSSDDGAGGHEAVLYFRPLADRDSDEFFADARYGEFWVGAG